MEKYGVDESGTIGTTGIIGTKKAYLLDQCPVCGAMLQKHGAVVLCPVHGSKPFEHDTEQKK